MKYNNIVEQLDYQALTKPNKTMMMFLDDNNNIIDKYTFRQFKILTDKLAKILYSMKLDKVLLVYPPGLQFMITFIACIKAKVIPIPVYPPNPNFLKKDMIMFSNIVKDSDVTVALTNKEYNWATIFANVKNLFSIKWPELKWIVTDDLQLNEKIILPKINDNDIAFIQYTSGSCSFPKAVIIRHRNLNHNLKIINKALLHDENSICISWLPQYHDMGLIGSRICTTVYGGTGIYISPFSFIMYPVNFIKLISQYKATHIQGPNFMYKLMARKWLELKDKPDINLSSMQHIFNAAEPINYQDYQFFYHTFKLYGLKKESLATGYGLAESVVYISDSGYNNIRGGNKLIVDTKLIENENRISIVENDGKEIMGCGKPPEGFDVDMIIVSNDEILPELEIGEICVNSPSVIDEYLTYQINDKKYLKTGDLGFLYNKELYVTGRCKDLIILNGKNYYPQDFEWIIEQNINIKKGSTAVFEDENNLVMISETKDISKENEFEELAKKIKNDIIDVFGIKISVFFYGKRMVPRTTSGKISRQKCKNIYKNIKNIYYMN